MTTNQTTPALTLEDWAASVRQLWADLARPIESADDPRYAELRTFTRSIDLLSPAELGETYFNRCVPLAAPPIPTPSWVESVDVRVSIYPEVEVEWSGKDHADGRFTGRAQKLFTVWVEAHEYADEDNRLAGDRTDPEPDVYVPGTLDDLTADRAESLARVLVLAAADLRRN